MTDDKPKACFLSCGFACKGEACHWWDKKPGVCSQAPEGWGAVVSSARELADAVARDESNDEIRDLAISLLDDLGIAIPYEEYEDEDD